MNTLAARLARIVADASVGFGISDAELDRRLIEAGASRIVRDADDSLLIIFKDNYGRVRSITVRTMNL